MSTAEHRDLVQLTAFKIGDEEYVVDILRVREVIRPVKITPVRRGPKFVDGVINLRGSVIPVVDMRRRFAIEEGDSRSRRIVILGVDGLTVGLIVDSVTEVVRVSRTSIQPAPGLLDGRRAPFFLGICVYKGRQLVLLSVRSIVDFDSEVTVATPEQVMRGGV